MIAAFVFAIAFTGIYGVYAGVMDVAEQVRGEGDLLQTGRLVLRQMGDDLAGLSPAKAPGNTQQGQAAEAEPALLAGERDEDLPDVSRDPDLARAFRRGKIVLELTTASSLDFEAAAQGGRLARVQYVLRPREDAGIFDEQAPRVLVRRERLDPDIHADTDSVFAHGGEPHGGWTEVELHDSVVELSLGFRARGGGESEIWGVGALGWVEQGAGLPAAVSMRIVLTSDGRSRQFSDVLSLNPELLPESSAGSIQEDDS